jgi:putative hydrolase of the HAD superfamily
MSSGIAGHVKKNIEAYMVERLGIDESKIESLGNLLYKNYGTTMAGLRVRLQPSSLMFLLLFCCRVA